MGLRSRMMGAALVASLAIVAAACSTPQLPEPGFEARAAAPAVEPRTAAAEPVPAVVAPPPERPASRIALLVPLSGPQQALGEAIRDGFIAGWIASGPPESRPDLVILDEAALDPVAAYRAAADGGATLVVGPLLKPAVAAAAAAGAPLPTLALNFLDGDVATPAGFYQFALSPEDEARQAALRATADGRRRAIALVPDNDWGRRMLAAFEAGLAERGGRVVAHRLYDPGATDFTADIERLLLLDESRDRHRRVVAEVGVSLGFEPRRRDDVDHIFLAATVAGGKLIWPQLRFLYAGDIPTYATSAIYQAGSSGDADLDGVMFTDVPVLLVAEPRAEALRAALARRWPAGSFTRIRFYAMGYDAWELARSLDTASPAGVAGLTGTLTMDEQRRFHREMPWARFRDGSVVPLPAVLP